MTLRRPRNSLTEWVGMGRQSREGSQHPAACVCTLLGRRKGTSSLSERSHVSQALPPPQALYFLPGQPPRGHCHPTLSAHCHLQSTSAASSPHSFRTSNFISEIMPEKLPEALLGTCHLHHKAIWGNFPSRLLQTAHSPLCGPGLRMPPTRECDGRVYFYLVGHHAEARFPTETSSCRGRNVNSACKELPRKAPLEAGEHLQMRQAFT